MFDSFFLPYPHFIFKRDIAQYSIFISEGALDVIIQLQLSLFVHFTYMWILLNYLYAISIEYDRIRGLDGSVEDSW